MPEPLRLFINAITDEIIRLSKTLSNGPRNQAAHTITSLLNICLEENKASAENTHKAADRLCFLPEKAREVNREPLAQLAEKVVANWRARRSNPEGVNPAPVPSHDVIELGDGLRGIAPSV